MISEFMVRVVLILIVAKVLGLLDMVWILIVVPIAVKFGVSPCKVGFHAVPLLSGMRGVDRICPDCGKNCGSGYK